MYASNARCKIQEHILEIIGDPTERQAREIPLLDKFLRDVILKIRLSVRTVAPAEIFLQCLLALFDRETEDAEVDVVGASRFG